MEELYPASRSHKSKILYLVQRERAFKTRSGWPPAAWEKLLRRNADGGTGRDMPGRDGDIQNSPRIPHRYHQFENKKSGVRKTFLILLYWKMSGTEAGHQKSPSSPPPSIINNFPKRCPQNRERGECCAHTTTSFFPPSPPPFSKKNWKRSGNPIRDSFSFWGGKARAAIAAAVDDSF